MNEKIINGKECSRIIREELKQKIRDLNNKLKLVVIRVGNDEASKIYVKSKEKACLEVGIDFNEIHFRDDVCEDVLIDKINELNNDLEVSGILVQLPLPNHLDTHKILNTIDYKKDVDGLTTINIGKLNNNEEAIIPCTARGVIDLLKYSNTDLEGKNVVIVGRSNLVGKPLISLLLKQNATVSVCHSKTANLKDYTKNSDVIICAVGHPNLITKDMIKEDCIIIDVGINRIDNKICGDVDYDNVINIVSKITPVPGGVGPMTIAMLMNNCVETVRK